MTNIDKMYNEMLKRCGIIEDSKMTTEYNQYKQSNHEQSTYGSGIKFERLRRCTGYLSGDYKTRFNDAKRAEVEDRVKHDIFCQK